MCPSIVFRLMTLIVHGHREDKGEAKEAPKVAFLALLEVHQGHDEGHDQLVDKGSQEKKGNADAGSSPAQVLVRQDGVPHDGLRGGGGWKLRRRSF